MNVHMYTSIIKLFIQDCKVNALHCVYNNFADDSVAKALEKCTKLIVQCLTHYWCLDIDNHIILLTRIMHYKAVPGNHSLSTKEFICSGYMPYYKFARSQTSPLHLA